MTTNTPPSEPLQTAVLFLVFNRPDTTARVFEAIRQAKPPRLYVAADGPRDGREGEAERIAKVRDIAIAVDWQCEVKTLFREKNLGCKYAVSSAITWFFEQEDQGIILEDDCLPSHSFFKFCEIMLQKYRENKSVWMINGFNPRRPGETSSEYFLSQNPSVWGWATWSDRWKHYSVNIDDHDVVNGLADLKLPEYVIRHYQKELTLVAQGQLDTWDYQLSYLIFINNGFVIKSYSNLISNIGVDGTHSITLTPNHNVPLGSMNFEKLTIMPKEHAFDEDIWFYEIFFKKTFIDKLLTILKRFISLITKI